MSAYSKKDFPWTFYFNGETMPKWGALWPSVPTKSSSWEDEVGPRDLYIISCKIGHVGGIESANPQVFVYAVQEILCLLLTERKRVLHYFEGQHTAGEPVDPEEIYRGVLESAFRMRQLARRDGHAFWTSGYDSDRLKLIEAIRRAYLPADHPQHQQPPHVRARLSLLKQRWDSQIKTLHRIAEGKGFPIDLRKRLLEL